MKLLVLAQTPPPLHGQSAMVRTVVDGLPAHGIEVVHAPLNLSDDAGDIGRWRLGKFWSARRAARHARNLAARHQCDALYYIPAPGKRIAVWRDAMLMHWVRPALPRLILHWHAVGLGDWIKHRASAIERRWAHRALDGADVAVVLAAELADDAAVFQPRRTAVVPNGIADPWAGGPSPIRPAPAEGEPAEVLFLGQCAASKGLHDTVRAVALAEGRLRLTVAGAFPDATAEAEFRRLAIPLGDRVRHVGFADATLKKSLLERAHVLSFPTRYPHEGQPLVLIEALAAGLPIVTTRWRAIPSLIPAGLAGYVEPRQPQALAAALIAAAAQPEEARAGRAHFERLYTREAFLGTLATVLA